MGSNLIIACHLGGTKVDSLIYSPLLPNSGSPRTYDGLMHVSDWFPTLLSIANITNFEPEPGYELDGIDQFSAMITNSNSPRSSMLYNLIYNVQGQNFDIWSSGGFAIRNSRYKLLHYYVNGNSRYYSANTAMDNDDDIENTGVCNPSTSGTYTYFLFDLWNDPNEYTNLYSNTNYDTVKVSFYVVSTSDFDLQNCRHRCMH